MPVQTAGMMASPPQLALGVALLQTLVLVLVCCLSRGAYAQVDPAFYNELDIGRNATTLLIRKAFRKIALKLHPEKHTDDTVNHAKFIAASEAFQVLKDDHARRRYDRTGKRVRPFSYELNCGFTAMVLFL